MQQSAIDAARKAALNATQAIVGDKAMALLYRAFSKAGLNVAAIVLQLYYVARSPEVPVWAKTAIFGALGYFVLVPDAIPDVAPVLGFTDDLAVLASALTGAAGYVTPEMRQRIRERLRGWFGEKADEVILAPEPVLALEDHAGDAGKSKT